MVRGRCALRHAVQEDHKRQHEREEPHQPAVDRVHGLPVHELHYDLSHPTAIRRAYPLASAPKS